MPPFPRLPADRAANAGVSVDEQQADLARWMLRHRVTRRAALRGAAGGGGALLLGRFALSGTASAATTRRGVGRGSYGIGFAGRHIAYGPDPTTQMWLAVQTTGQPPSGAHTVVVEYGHDRSYGAVADVEVRDLVSQVPQADGSVYGAQQWYLHALLSGLRPGTHYHYRWVLADGTATPDARFRTAPKPGSIDPFVFTAIADEGINGTIVGFSQPAPYPGQTDPANEFTDDYYAASDTRRSSAPADTLVALIAADAPAFNLVGGDICYADPSGDGLLIDNQAGGSYEDYDPYVWDTYLALIDQSAARSPWMFASGNHDMEMVYLDPTGATPQAEAGYQPHGYGGLLHRLDLGRNGPLAGGAPNPDPSVQSLAPTVYSFTHQNVAVLSIDANELSYEIPANLGYSGGAQAAWIASQLQTYRSDPSIDFIVAFFHQCAYCTSTTHGSDGGVRSVLDPLFSQYKVDLVFQGHNHQYERTDPIRNGQPTGVAPIGSTIHPDTDGTTYVVVGSGGRPHYAFSAPDTYAGHDPSSSVESVAAFVDEKGGGTTDETVTWSRVRYADYAYARVEAHPAPQGQRTTLHVSAISDQSTVIDRFVLARRAGAAALESYGPPAQAPESPLSVALPLAAAGVVGGALALHHRRSAPGRIEAEPTA